MSILVATQVSPATLLGRTGASLELVAGVPVNVHGPTTSAPFTSVSWTNAVTSRAPDFLGPGSNFLAAEALAASLNTRKWESSLLAVPGTLHWCILATGNVGLW